MPTSLTAAINKRTVKSDYHHAQCTHCSETTVTDGESMCSQIQA